MRLASGECSIVGAVAGRATSALVSARLPVTWQEPPVMRTSPIRPGRIAQGPARLVSAEGTCPPGRALPVREFIGRGVGAQRVDLREEEPPIEGWAPR